MSSTAGQWEFVGKKSKQSQGKGKLAKSDKKKLLEAAPKVEDVVPLKHLETLYKVYDVGDTDSKKPTSKETKTKENDQKKIQQKKKPEKKKEETKVKPPKTLEEAAKLLDVEELASLLESVQLRFRDSPSIWLKDLVSYLNEKLAVEFNDPVFLGKPWNYPLNLLSSKVVAVLNNAINACNTQTIQMFYEHCLSTMASDMVKGLPVFGYKMLLQLLSHRYPEVSTGNSAKCGSIWTSYMNRQNVGLSILWVRGQGGYTSLSVGLRVWLEQMLPVIELKNYSRYVVEYLASLFERHSTNVKEPALTPQQLFKVIDYLLFSSVSISPQLQRELTACLPKLKAVAFGPEPADIVQNFFPLFLQRLQPSSSDIAKQELLSSLVFCLQHNSHCYSSWRQMYTKHLPQSSLLLKYLCARWNVVSRNLPSKPLKETLTSFRATNDDLTKVKGSSEGLQECSKHCEELWKKMTSSSWFPWRLANTILLIALVALVTYDVREHGSFRASSTGRFLDDVGALQYGEHAWVRTKVYSQKTYRWAEKNVPVYYQQVSEQTRPYLQLAWNKTLIAGQYAQRVGENAVNYTREKAPLVRDWINRQAPGLTDKLWLYTMDAWELTRNYAQLAWEAFMYYSIVALEWLRTNVFVGKLSPENLQKYTLEAVNMVQHYTVQTYQWIVKAIEPYAKRTDGGKW